MKEQEMRKVAFVGTSCTGKTTLVNHYREKFKENAEVVIVEEAARIYFENHPEVEDRFSNEFQSRIQELAQQNEQEAHFEEARVILCDRSVLDAAAYSLAMGDKDCSDRLFERVKSWIPTYSCLFLLDPSDVRYSTDEVRKENENLRGQFHRAFLELFREKKVPYKLLSGTLQERIQQIDEILEKNY